MVHSRDTATRSFDRAVLLCALSLSVFSSANAQASGEATCLWQPGSADNAIGITFVTDPTCASGGIGCMTEICRYCRVSATSPVMFVPACTSDEAESITMSPAPSTLKDTPSETCFLSDDDRKAGIQVIDDTDCTYGGLGCSGDSCRFCKVLNTEKSSHLKNCTSFGYDLPTPAPVVISSDPCVVSEADIKEGISVVTDTQCVYGGLGCYDNHCRLCELDNATKATGYSKCSSLEPSSADETEGTSVLCTFVASTADEELGINIKTDPTCTADDTDCVSDVCRLCRKTTTGKSKGYIDCDLLQY